MINNLVEDWDWLEIFQNEFKYDQQCYFNRQITQQIFDEIFRVLKPEGIIAGLFNSKTDSEYGKGEQLEEDYFDLPDKGPKRYFSIDTLQPFVRRFETVFLDDKGSDPRRDHKEDLIRFVGRKLK